MTARLLAAHVAVGEATALDLERFFGIPRSTVTVIHNGVARDTPPPTDLGRRPVVGSAGRLEDQKQLDVLVHAMVDLPGVRLVLVGDGERRGALTHARVPSFRSRQNRVRRMGARCPPVHRRDGRLRAAISRRGVSTHDRGGHVRGDACGGN